MDTTVKQEPLPVPSSPAATHSRREEESVTVIDICSDDDSDDVKDVVTVGAKRGRRDSTTSGGFSEVDAKIAKTDTVNDLAIALPESISRRDVSPEASSPDPCNVSKPSSMSGGIRGCRQFWKAGDYEGGGPSSSDWDLSSGSYDHVRVHPKFLHSNATSHKWALGAFAELLDNALDEVASGATYVNVDMLENEKTGNRMLLIEDNGGGMDPEKMRQCMSLGYSAKSKLANTIGQYGNGFKTSTMRLGADVIVFSRCPGKDGKSSTQSIGLLSYTFLRSTGKEDIVVPMLDYERRDTEWSKILRSSLTDWYKNVETIVQWSPFSSEEDLLQQFDQMNDRGTRIIVYNLWEDDQGMSELDFDADLHDIQLRGVNRDEKNIKMAIQFPNSRHFLTYKHSLRSYASILYLRIPSVFRIILRGQHVEHHNIVNDMMEPDQVTYRPHNSGDSNTNDSNMAANVTIGFVKDAKDHVDVQGFNVYHKNRLIKPFWRLWNSTGSDGRGVIGVLEANFVEPAHDKQGFERTTVLSRLESKLILMQKRYWRDNCHKIGYARRRHRDSNGYDYREASPENDLDGSEPSGNKTRTPASQKSYSYSYPNHKGDNGASGKVEALYLQAELRREKDQCKALEIEAKRDSQKLEELKKEKENLVEVFSKERERRDVEEECLRHKLEEATNTIDELLNKIKQLDASNGPSWRR